MTLVPLWIVSAEGWKEKPGIVTVCALGLALGLVVEVLAVGLALEVAEVVVAFTVGGLGLGLGFEVEAHPATSSGATTSATIIISKYLLTFDPFLQSLEVKKLERCMKIIFCHFLRETPHQPHPRS